MREHVHWQQHGSMQTAVNFPVSFQFLVKREPMGHARKKHSQWPCVTNVIDAARSTTRGFTKVSQKWRSRDYGGNVLPHLDPQSWNHSVIRDFETSETSNETLCAGLNWKEEDVDVGAVELLKAAVDDGEIMITM